MSKIITINRQFGSGGRELGKRLAEELGYAYYDNEIITQIAGRSGLAENYVNNIVEKKPSVYYPITIGRTFLTHTPQPMDFNTQVYAQQHAIIKELADKSDCVIIGRCADYILADRNPLRIFVYADMASRMERCRSKAPKDEKPMTDKQLSKHITQLDEERSDYYKFFTGQKWTDAGHYDLMINTSNMVIKDFVPVLAQFAQLKK